MPSADLMTRNFVPWNPQHRFWLYLDIWEAVTSVDFSSVFPAADKHQLNQKVKFYVLQSVLFQN